MKLSVITVNLNNKSGLEKTIKSVVAQSFHDFEFIIIDGGSSDGSVDIINQYKQKISYWISEKDKGTYHAMNKGIAQAKGEYCYFLNSGDFVTDDHVFENIFSRNISADIISGNILKLRKNGKYRVIIPHEKPSLHKLCLHSLPHQATLIRLSLFNELGLYNESYKIVSDFDFFVRALVMNKKSYQRLNINFSYFNLTGISSQQQNKSMAMQESARCLKNNFPDYVDDLLEYRNFYLTNIGQTILILQKKEKLYLFIEKILGWMIAFKKIIMGK